MTDPARRESELLLYQAPNGAVKVSVLFRDETAWLTQKALAELFGVGMPAVTKHLSHIFESGELVEKAVVSVLETTASDGKTHKTRFYNLDAIIAVGYRVNSSQATQFRIWANGTPSEGGCGPKAGGIGEGNAHRAAKAEKRTRQGRE